MNENAFNRVSIEIKKTYYVHERYQYIATFALLYHEQPLDVTTLGSFLRISDHLVKIDAHHYFVNFAFTKQEDAFKASQNLLLYLDKHFNNHTSCIAIDTFETSKTATIVVNRLTEILAATKKSSYGRIEDENILNGFL